MGAEGLPRPRSAHRQQAVRHADGAWRKREAQTALAEMVTEAERGLTVRTTATVGELLEAWFEFAAPDFSPKTVKEARGYIDRSLMPALGTRRLAKLKPADIDAFYRRLLTSGGSAGRPLAPGTVNASTAFCGVRSTRESSGGGSASTLRRQPRRRACRRRTSNRRRQSRSDECSDELRWTRRIWPAT